MELTDLHITKLGRVDFGIDGSDEYILAVNKVDDMDIEAAEALFLQTYYHRCRGPGTYFCDRVRAIPDPLHTDRCIVIVSHSYDV